MSNDTPLSRMPALFVGHGSPMNCVADNAFTRDMRALGTKLPRPKAILAVSAHWLTRGTFVTADAQPETIHDFYGFPDALYALRYPAPGAPDVAQRIAAVTGGVVQPAAERGLDHAAWMVLRNMYPAADVPTLEMSLDMSLSERSHYELGARLASLRHEGVLVIGSGNIVHNLRIIDWHEDAPTAGWAREFDTWAADAIAERRHDDLIDYLERGPQARMAAPTADHYLPLLYALALQRPDETVATVHESFQHATVSMRCVQLG
jgi:4,5-DOPA dioxygenase extradiol